MGIGAQTCLHWGMRGLLLTFSALAIAGCDTPDATTSADAAPVNADAQPRCTYNDIAVEAEVVERDTELDVLFYSGRRGQEPEIERISLDFYFPFGATDGPHQFSFDGENLQDCHTCLLMRRHCKESNCISGQVFLAQEGSANLTAMGAVGADFTARLQNILLAEVTIGSMLKTTVVPGGETWCIDSMDLNVEVTSPQ